MSCELTQEQRAAQNKIVEVAWKALKGAGLDPEEWMLMEWRKTGDTWNGDTLFHFKSIDQRLYIYIPSKWAAVERYTPSETVRKGYAAGAPNDGGEET